MCNTKLGNFCLEHDNWQELLQEKPYCLKIKQDGPYIIFNYDQIHSTFSNLIVQEARGIIFRTGEWKNPVCWAFNKFGNYGESWVHDIDWESAFVTEKVDGSLMKVWFDDVWHISTNGTINALDASTGDIIVNNFDSYFYLALKNYFDSPEDFFKHLDPDLTYMFELVGPYNRVVVEYPEPALYFLGARDKCTGTEVRFSDIKDLSKIFKVPQIYKLDSIDACLEVTEAMDWQHEGFVVADKNFDRVKVKSAAYVLAHYLRNNCVINRRHLLRVIIEHEEEEFLCYASDYADALMEVKAEVLSFKNQAENLVLTAREWRHLNKKDFALRTQELPKVFHSIIFRNYEQDVSVDDFTKAWDSTRWEKILDEFKKQSSRT